MLQGRFVVWAAVVLSAAVSGAQEVEMSSPSAPKANYQGKAPLMIMSVDGKQFRPMVFLPGYEMYGAPMWSHDGKRLAFDAHTGSLTGTHVFVVNADGSSPRDLGLGAMPTWSPDDRRLAIHRYNQDQGIWVMDADGKGMEKLTPPGISPRWRPDGTQISYLGSTDGSSPDYGLVTFNTVEGALEMLLSCRHLPAPYRSISLGYQWSSTGDRVAFKAEGGNGSAGLFVWTPGQPEQPPRLRLATSRGMGGLPAWSPDGKELLVPIKGEEDRMLQIYRVHADGNAPPVRLPGQDPARAADDLAWSPDGKWVVFSSEVLD